MRDEDSVGVIAGVKRNVAGLALCRPKAEAGSRLSQGESANGHVSDRSTWTVPKKTDPSGLGVRVENSRLIAVLLVAYPFH